MATLTNSYQKVAEKKMGSWGYGTLYLRTYAKINSQSIDNNQSSVSIQSRVYNNGGWCESGDCYNTLMGTKVKNDVWITFDSGEITLGTVTKTYTHNVDGSKDISLTNTFKCYALGSTIFNANVTVSLPKINRMDKATGLDFDIGSATLITITRYNENYSRTVVASIGTFSETLLEKGTSTQISWQPDEDALYSRVTTSNVGTITLTTTTYDGDTVIGTQTSTLKCRVTDASPLLSARIITDSLAIVDENTLVKNLSIPKFEIRALGTKFATIESYTVTELNSVSVTSTNNVIVLPNTVKTNSFTIKLTDSRGNSSENTVSSNNFIEYTLPAISKLDLVRTGENLDQIQASITGVWFNQPINGVANSISLKYRFKSGGEYSEYIPIPEVPTEANFSFETVLNPAGGFDTNSVFTIEVVLTDSLTSGALTALIGKAIPLIDHWNDGEKDFYNINAEIQQNGEPLFGSQKVLWQGAWYMRDGQTANLSENVTDQKNGIVLIWSHYDGEPKNAGFTFFFVPKTYIDLINDTGYGCNFSIVHYRFNPIINKYVYIYNNRIIGNDINEATGTANGVTYANNRMVLRYVIGV